MSHHITTHDRAALAVLLRAGLNQKEAATELGKGASAISKELKRNARDDGVYDARSASRMARARRDTARQSTRKIENDPHLARAIETLLRNTYSPAQIAATLGTVSHPSIYAWIKNTRPDLKKYLRRRGKKRRRYGTSQVPTRYQAAKRPISERPAIVERRSRLGDWEGDTARGGDRTSALLVYAERKSRYLIGAPLLRATGDDIRIATRKLFKGKPLHTITYDNGSEFAHWQFIERDLNIKIYFARAGHPEERGTNENGIGLLREFFPKGTDFDPSMQSALTRALHLINHRPRKVLEWKTACQVFGGGCC
jgi:IS30 family transposase